MAGDIVLPHGKPEQKAWAAPFLDALAKFGIVSVACRAASVGRSTVYSERASNPDFAALWKDAYDEAVDTLETLLWKRATAGDVYEKRTETRKNAEGEDIVTTIEIHRISDTAMIFALKGARPEKFRDNVRVEQTGPGGLPIQVEVGPMVRTKERVEKLLELARESETATEAEHNASGNGG